MPCIIGIKIGMVSLPDVDGNNIPCTIIKAGPCQVIQKKIIERDGYSAIQIGFEEKKEKHTNRSLLGFFKKNKATPKKILKEFRLVNDKNLKVGDEIRVDSFSEGIRIFLTGISKGKGFQGVVKRHGFAGVGQSTHGQHNRLRAPGSIGAGSTPSRVFKGMKMAGRMGGEKVTLICQVFKVDKEANLLIVKGSVPGPKKSYVSIYI